MKLSMGTRAERTDCGQVDRWLLWLVRRRRRFFVRHTRGASRLQLGRIWFGPYRIACQAEFWSANSTLHEQRRLNRKVQP
jgi:hypothetical protein